MRKKVRFCMLCKRMEKGAAASPDGQYREYMKYIYAVGQACTHTVRKQSWQVLETQ